MQATRLSRFISLALFCAIGAGAIVIALRLGLWRQGSPGPGLMPFIASAGIVTLTGIGMIATVLQSPSTEPRDEIAIAGRWRVVTYVVGLIAYGLLLEPLGFYASTVLSLFVLLKLAERLPFKIIIPVIGGAILFSHLLFVRWLGVYFPEGYLWDFLR